MRKFSSYGPVLNHRHYYAPRTELIDKAESELVGDYPEEGGHYITVWAPRQTGKSWVMRQVIKRVRTRDDFEIGVISLQSAKNDTDDVDVLETFVDKLEQRFKKNFPKIQKWKEISSLFTSNYFSKPVILVIDEFDALQEDFINRFANEFRDIYLNRFDESGIPSGEKSILLHGLALIGVRTVLGIENVSGSPFNVQRSLHIPNLTKDEVRGLFHWYEQESGQRVLPEVVDRIYTEFQGQPGLTCWMGELLTETHNRHNTEITMFDFNTAYTDALDEQPNNNILNIISKAKMEQYTPTVLSMYKTNRKLVFRYDNPITNYLYMNGVVGRELVCEPNGINKRYLKFPYA
ncbi:MAG: AAA-like domain-containing protein [Chloroflexota bacterium]